MLTVSGGGRCPLCGVQHAACGPATATTTPVDVLAMKESTVATQKYRVTVNGHRTTLKLSAEDAKNYPDAELLDDTEPTAEPSPTPARKSTPAKSRTAANKARTDTEDK